MDVKLISSTPDGEDLIAYCARVSSPNQENPNITKLLKYCLAHSHVSIFEHAYMTVEIVTSRAIGRQILRHRSFVFQEFSQRYAEAVAFEPITARRQAVKNRQSSVDDLDISEIKYFEAMNRYIKDEAMSAYKEALSRGVAKECARFLLPESVQTKMYMTGSVRSWIHYLRLRTGEDTQLEHREVALSIKGIFCNEYPIIGDML